MHQQRNSQGQQQPLPTTPCHIAVISNTTTTVAPDDNERLEMSLVFFILFYFQFLY